MKDLLDLMLLSKKSAHVYNCERDNWQAEHQNPSESCWEKPQTLNRTAGACVHKRHPSVPSQKPTHPTKTTIKRFFTAVLGSRLATLPIKMAIGSFMDPNPHWCYNKHGFDFKNSRHSKLQDCNMCLYVHKLKYLCH